MQVFLPYCMVAALLVRSGGKSALDIPRLYSQVGEEEEGERIARVLALVVLPWVVVYTFLFPDVSDQVLRKYSF